MKNALQRVPRLLPVCSPWSSERNCFLRSGRVDLAVRFSDSRRSRSRLSSWSLWSRILQLLEVCDRILSLRAIKLLQTIKVVIVEMRPCDERLQHGPELTKPFI